MPFEIAISDKVIDLAMEIPEESRDFVEVVKANNQVDDVIIAAGLKRVKGTLPGIAAQKTDPARAEVATAVCESLDVAIALIALAEGAHEVEQVKRLATLLGRRHKEKVVVDQQRIYPALRAVFQKVGDDQDLEHLRPHDRRKALVRRKVRAAIKIINESLAHRDTRGHRTDRDVGGGK
jgi:hypothetical protein